MDPAPRAPTIFECRIEVRSYELDSFGHANHAVFFNYFEHARFQALTDAGLDRAELARLGWSLVVVHAEADFRRQALQGDHVTVRTWADKVRSRSLVLLHEIRRDDGDDVIATGGVVTVCLGADGKAIRLPAAVASAFGVDLSAR